MSDIYSALETLVGTIPDGLEPVAWVISSIILVFLLSSTYRIVISIFEWFK